MSIQLGFDLIRETFTQTNIFGVEWILTAIITFIVILLIAGKNIGDYKVLILPVTISLHIVGLTPNLLQYIIGILVFVMDTISLEILGNIAETTYAGFKRTTESIGMATSRIYDRQQYRETKEAWKEERKKLGIERLKGQMKRRLQIGITKEGAPIYKALTTEQAIEQARKQGLGKTISKDKEIEAQMQKAYSERLEQMKPSYKYIAMDRNRAIQELTDKFETPTKEGEGQGLTAERYIKEIKAIERKYDERIKALRRGFRP